VSLGVEFPPVLTWITAMFSEFGFVIAVTLALSIGANNAGIAMGPVYGAAIRSRWASLALVALFYLLGALVLGHRGIATVGRELFTVPLSAHPYGFLLIAPTAALVLMVVATLLRVPISTTHAAVAALVGVGLYLDVVRGDRVLRILAWWLATPLASFLVTWPIAKLVGRRTTSSKAIGWLLTFGGCYVAFSVGANNAANAAAVLAGAGLVSPFVGALIAGVAMAAGGATWGGRVLETVGKGLAELNAVRSVVVALVAGTTTLVASAFGVPISLTLVVASSVIAFGIATDGVRQAYRNNHVRRIAVLWTTSPLIAVGSTYAIAWALKR